MFFSIMIIIHSVLSAPGVVRQIGLSSQRTPKRAVPRAAQIQPAAVQFRAQRNGSIALPASGYHEDHPAAGLVPTGGPARQPAGPVAMTTTGSPEAGPAAGRGRGSLEHMRGTASSPTPFIPLSPGSVMLQSGACAKRTRRQPAGGACAPRPPSSSPRGCAGGVGRGPRGAEWKPEAEVPRASKPLFSPVRRLLPGCPAPAVPGPNRPNRCRPAAPPRPPREGLLPAEPPPSLPGGAAGPSSPRPPARLSARRPRCPTRNSCGPSKMGTWMR